MRCPTLVASIACSHVIAATVVSGQDTRPAAATRSQQQVERIVREVLDEDGVPALAALVMRGERIVANAAAGVRRADHDAKVTTGDRWHLGSCTKSMTATVLGILVERELLGWDTTLGALVAEHAPDATVHDGLHEVTIDLLLRHRSGLAANPPRSDYEDAERAHAGDVRAQRQFVAMRMLSRPAEHSPAGSMEVYSNTGYIVAGALAELVTERSWEQLMRTELFEPLGMTSAGFGPPGDEHNTDEPFGHVESELGKLTPLFHDNPAPLGPAGTVHATLEDWAKYARLHLRGMRGEPTGFANLSTETLAHLHDPSPNRHYASGWVVRGRSGRRRVWHNGSNTMWFAECMLLEAENVAVLVATNVAAEQASAVVMRRILTKLKHSAAK